MKSFAKKQISSYGHHFHSSGQRLVDIMVMASAILIIFLLVASERGLSPFSALQMSWWVLLPSGMSLAMSIAALSINERRLGYLAHFIITTAYAMLAFGSLSQDNYSLSLMAVMLIFIASGMSRLLVITEVISVVILTSFLLINNSGDDPWLSPVALISIFTIITGIVGVVFSGYLRGARIDSSQQSMVASSDIELDTVLGSVDEGLAVISPEGPITGFNPAAGSIVGLNPSDALGIDYRLVIKFADSQGKPIDPAISPLAKAAGSKDGRYSTSELVMLNSNNSAVPVSVSVSITDVNHDKPSYVLVFRDISEELSDIKKKSDFVSTASHEMRTPITAIEGYLALAMNTKVTQLDPKASELVGKAYKSTRELGQLFRDLLETTEATDGRMKLNPEMTSLNKLLLGLYDRMALMAKDKRLNVAMYVGRKPLVPGAILPQLQADIDQVRVSEAIMNLFENAVKYTMQGGIAIILNGDDKNVLLSMKDTGIGIPAEDLPHMFQKFYRVDNSDTREIGGTGLGLFISRSIIEQSGGAIWVESVQGKGSTFHIRLPRTDNLTKAQVL